VQLVHGEIESDKAVYLQAFDNWFQKIDVGSAPTADPKNMPVQPPRWKTLQLTFFIHLGSGQFF
jgi:hypothetical protein